jgi:flagellar biosynthesis/type III secretory pathway M-ring protein FliF/YscJ
MCPLLLQIIMVAGFVLLAVFGWFAKKAINKITAEEEEREKAEEEARQQQQQEEAEAAATAAAGAPADVEAGLCVGGVAGAKDVDAVPTSGTGADQQQQQPQQQAEAGVPRMVWQDSDLALKRGLGPNSK